MHQFEACNREEIRCWSGNILVEPPGASLLGVGVDSRSCLIAVAIVSGDSLIQSGVRNANARCQAAQNTICCPRCWRGNLFFVLLRGIAGGGGFALQPAGVPQRLANQVCFLCGVRGSECSGSAVGFGIPRIISLMPPELINLPKKQYWLAPEHLLETHAFLNFYFAWFGCAVFLVMILTFDYASQSNLHPDNRPDISRM